MKNKNITRVRVLYGLFGGILLICLGLFFSRFFSAVEEPKVGSLDDFATRYAFTVTDLLSSAPLYAVEHPVEGLPEGVTAHAHVNRFDIDCYSDDQKVADGSSLSWAMGLQVAELLSLVAILVLMVVALVSFYRSAKRGRVFPQKCVTLVAVIGLLVVVGSLCADMRTFIERRVVYDLLKGTEWVPQARYTIHFTRIFFGLTVIFLSQVIRIGREMQDEQELTV